MTTFAITGRCLADPAPPDWRARLINRLGFRPRRMGVWAELGLYGVLECLADAGEAALPGEATILAASRHGAAAAIREAVAQARIDMPMPLTFLQTQPSQMLALVAAQIGWTGNACFVTSDHPQDLLRLAAVQAGPKGVLIGWVDEVGAGRSVWLRLFPSDVQAVNFQIAKESDIFTASARYLRIGPAGDMEVS